MRISKLRARICEMRIRAMQSRTFQVKTVILIHRTMCLCQKSCIVWYIYTSTVPVVGRQYYGVQYLGIEFREDKLADYVKRGRLRLISATFFLSLFPFCLLALW